MKKILAMFIAILLSTSAVLANSSSSVQEEHDRLHSETQQVLNGYEKIKGLKYLLQDGYPDSGRIRYDIENTKKHINSYHENLSPRDLFGLIANLKLAVDKKNLHISSKHKNSYHLKATNLTVLNKAAEKNNAHYEWGYSHHQ